jgi:hypothetical protein
MRNRLIAQALRRLILQLRLVLAGFMIKADSAKMKNSHGVIQGYRFLI